MRVFWSLMLVLFVASMGVFVRPKMPERVPTRGEQARIVREPMDEPPVISREPLGEWPATKPEGGVGAAESIDARLDPSEHEGAVRESFDKLQEQADAPAEGGEAGDSDRVPEAESDQVSRAPFENVQIEEATPADPFAAAAEAYLRSTRTDAANESATPEPTTAKPVPESDAIARADEPAAQTQTQAQAQTQSQAQRQAEAEPVVEKPPAFVVNADGSLEIQGKTVPGAGTRENPFVLDWPLLTGVAREYKPEKGLNELPGWLALLEGKRVRLTGHVVLPLVATSSDELLLTMNPWDGCCVGVPPTPYDALEVTLASPVEMQGASMYGTLEGTFRADPYIAGGWLLGLYLIDDARVVR